MITNSDMQMGTLLTKDYKELITNRSVTDQVIQNLDLNMTNEALANNISVESLHPIPESLRSAWCIRALGKRKRLRMQSGDFFRTDYGCYGIGSCKSGRYSQLSQKPFQSEHFKNVVLAALSVCTCHGRCYFVFILDDRIRTPEDVEKYLGSSVLGMLRFDRRNPEQENKEETYRPKKGRALIEKGNIMSIINIDQAGATPSFRNL